MSSLFQELFSKRTSSESIKYIYVSLKNRNSKFSLAYLCRKAGIPSKGYLSQVINGKRTLNKTYAAGLVRAFNLEPLQADYLKTLVRYEHERDPKKQITTLTKLERIRKQSETIFMPLPPEINQPVFMLEVFCSLGLFSGRATIDELGSYFGNSKKSALLLALAALQKAGLLKSDNRGNYSLTGKQYLFSTSSDSKSHLTFLDQAITEAKHNVAKLYSQPEKTFFESSIVSVSKARYRKALPKIKKIFRQIQSDLETENGDELVRFNIQIYERPKS